VPSFTVPLTFTSARSSIAARAKPGRRRGSSARRVKRTSRESPEIAPLTVAFMRDPLPDRVSSTVSAPPGAAVRTDPSKSTKPGGSNATCAGLPGDDGRTVIVMQFSSRATALTGARNDAHSFGC
jgi:hypothetical protein